MPSTSSALMMEPCAMTPASHVPSAARAHATTSQHERMSAWGKKMHALRIEHTSGAVVGCASKLYDNEQPKER